LILVNIEEFSLRGTHSRSVRPCVWTALVAARKSWLDCRLISFANFTGCERLHTANTGHRGSSMCTLVRMTTSIRCIYYILNNYISQTRESSQRWIATGWRVIRPQRASKVFSAQGCLFLGFSFPIFCGQLYRAMYLCEKSCEIQGNDSRKVDQNVRCLALSYALSFVFWLFLNWYRINYWPHESPILNAVLNELLINHLINYSLLVNYYSCFWQNKL